MVGLANVLLRNVPSYSAFYETLDRRLEEEPPSRACLMHAAREAIVGSAGPAMRVPSQVGFWLFVLKDAIELHVARTLALIAAHPDVQARVRDEIRACGTPTAASIDGLRHLEACIAEQLRLWTPVPLLLRRAEEAFTLGDGIAIGEEQQLLIHAGFHHRDPRVFGERADAFRPDAALPPTYVFSAHDRGCAGRSLATFVLKATLAPLLARSRFELLGPAIQPGRIPYLYDHFGIELRSVASA
jgi:cytochrome P450